LFPGGTIGLIAGILRVYWLTRSKVEEFFGVKGEWGARMADLKHTLYLLRRNPLVIAGTIIALLFILMGLLANFIVDPILATPGGYPGQTYPFERKYMWSADNIINWGSGIALYHGPDFFWLGTDSYGRDLLKMIILAIPVDLYNATIIVTIAAVFGTFLGAVAGYVGGVFDEALLRITDVFFAFPGLVLALVFAALLGRSIETLQLAIVLVWWPPYVRLMRGQVLSEKEKPYVEALRALGASHSRILFRHVILNSIFPIIVQATMDFGGVILTFSALMFLGFSPSPAMPELGNLAADGYGHIFDAPWVMLFPGLTMLIISLAFNLVGDGLRDVLDPRLRR
jgi:peptide/nickel transport system permease protein